MSIIVSSNFTICIQNSINRNISNSCIIISSNNNVIIFIYFVYLILEGFIEFFCLFSFPLFGLLLMPINNSQKSLEILSDKTLVSSASKFNFLTSLIVIPGQCNFSCSREEQMKVSPRHLKTETFG